MCYDVITSQIIKPTPLEEKGSKLTNECYHCHGGMWELTQRVGSKPVKDMTKDEITKALYGYKDKNYGDNLKDVMENQVRDLGKEDIDTIVEYILYKRDK
jgi:cytochrome c553